MADSTEVTELDMLKLAAAVDAGLETVPKDEPEEDTETEVTSSGDNEHTPAPAEEAKKQTEASDEVSSTKEKSEDDKSSLTKQPSED